MGVSSPYLFEGDSPAITVSSDIDASIAVLTISGTWDRQLWQRASTALRKCLAEHPVALIVDLSGLDDPAAVSAPTWLTAQAVAAGMKPPVQVAMCVPPDLVLADRLQRMGARRFLPVYAKVRQALVAIQSRLPLTDRLGLRLAARPESTATAGDLVARACRAWELTRLAAPARAVAEELVRNAVEHAGTTVHVVVSRRGTGLHLAVADCDSRLPHLLEESAGGLHTVDALATVWGAMPTGDGKVVWATIRPLEGIRRRRA